MCQAKSRLGVLSRTDSFQKKAGEEAGASCIWPESAELSIPARSSSLTKRDADDPDFVQGITVQVDDWIHHFSRQCPDSARTAKNRVDKAIAQVTGMLQADFELFPRMSV